MSRVMSVAGSFYPDSCSEVEGYIKGFNTILKEHSVKVEKQDTRAIIVPHAGYIYSGFTANIAYLSVDTVNIKRVIVIGPSHRVYLEGISLALYDKYETPCGNLNIDIEFSKKIVDEYPFALFYPEAHKEHSTETQFPFIKHYFGDVEVVEIVYGNIEPKLLSLLFKEIVEDKENLLVVSSDLSHFYDIQKAKRLDNICLEGILKKDNSILDSGCEACGIKGIKALVEVAKRDNFEIKLLDYRTSYDVTQDDKSVVGYVSLLIK